jgi:serine/threonine-protein kinase RsbW
MAIPEAIRAPAKLESLQPLRGFVASCAQRRGFGPKRIREVELVMEELLVNIFSYAYPDRPGDVELSCGGDDAGRLLVELRDAGVPFDILASADPDLRSSIEERNIGGLGIFFVKRLVQDIRYRREEGKNILTLSVDPAPVDL